MARGNGEPALGVEHELGHAAENDGSSVATIRPRRFAAIAVPACHGPPLRLGEVSAYVQRKSGVSDLAKSTTPTHFNPLFTTSANYTCRQERRSTYFHWRNNDLREKYNNDNLLENDEVRTE